MLMPEIEIKPLKIEVNLILCAIMHLLLAHLPFWNEEQWRMWPTFHRDYGFDFSFFSFSHGCYYEFGKQILSRHGKRQLDALLPH